MRFRAYAGLLEKTGRSWLRPAACGKGGAQAEGLRHRAAFALFAGAVVAGLALADVRDCVCNLDSPDIGQTRGCSLCVEAAKHPASERVVLVRDNDPTKPNRWLAMPRAAYDGANPLAKMSAAERRELWDAAIAKGRELWGDSWAVAFNGDIARRQCHAHSLQYRRGVGGHEPVFGQQCQFQSPERDI